MSPNVNSRPVAIRRVRTRTHANGSVELHATYTDGRRLWLPANGTYRSRHVHCVEPVR